MLDDGTSRFGRRFEIRAAKGRLTLVPTAEGGEPATVGGRPLAGPAHLVNDDVIAIGERHFRFRRFPEAAL